MSVPLPQLFFWLVTPASAIAAMLQLRKKKQSRIKNFENELNRRYRDLTREIPVRALLGEELDDDEFEEQFQWLYYYIDFTNEQVYLRKEGKISHETWQEWRAGIESHMERPAFERAWQEVDGSVDDDFDELRTLLQSEDLANEDPREWEYDCILKDWKYWLEQKSPVFLPITVN